MGFISLRNVFLGYGVMHRIILVQVKILGRDVFMIHISRQVRRFMSHSTTKHIDASGDNLLREFLLKSFIGDSALGISLPSLLLDFVAVLSYGRVEFIIPS